MDITMESTDIQTNRLLFQKESTPIFTSSLDISIRWFHMDIHKDYPDRERLGKFFHRILCPLGKNARKMLCYYPIFPRAPNYQFGLFRIYEHQEITLLLGEGKRFANSIAKKIPSKIVF